MAPEAQISRNAQYGLIVNPLSSIDEAALLENVRRFYENHELWEVVNLKLLKRGALLAQDPGHLVPHERDDDPYTNKVFEMEQEALKRERAGTIWSLTKDLKIIIITCAIGAIVQGWSQENIVGANLNWPADLQIANRDATDNNMEWDYFDKDPTKDFGLKYFGLVNAMPYFAASVFGAWVSDPITYVYGRRAALFFAALCSLGGPIGSAYCNEWKQLLFCRFVQGVGMGAKASVVPILESEVAPSRLRGRLLVSWQTFVAVGILFGASANCIFHGQWRYQVGIAFVPAIPLLCLCYVIPESPRWLMRKQKYKEAYLVFEKLRETPLQAARDFYLVYAQLQLETLLASGKQVTSTILTKHLQRTEEQIKENQSKPASLRDFFSRVPELFKDDRNRRAVIGASVVMIAQQFSGINVFAFLATTIFEDSGHPNMDRLWMTLGFAASNAIFSPTAYFLIDRLGRRTLLLSSLALMFPFLLLTGHYLDVQSRDKQYTAAAILLIIIYTAMYSPGAGVIPFMYSSEVFPQVYREVGMSLAVAVNFSFAGALAMAVPQYASGLRHNKFILLAVFAGLDALAAVMVWLFMRSPEKPVELEDMNFLFGARSADYILYQISHVLVVNLHWFLCLGADTKHKLTFAEWQRLRVEDPSIESGNSERIPLSNRQSPTENTIPRS